LDLLEGRFQGHAHWTIEVKDEIIRGIAGTPQLSDVITAAWLDEPIRSLAVTEIDKVRRALGGKTDDRRHLGDAATIVVAGAESYIVAIDDYDAIRIAQARGLGTTTTIAILRECVGCGFLKPDEAHGLCDEMIDTHGRRLPRLEFPDPPD
jgi:predicted nucleic acid-binding protein